MNGIHVLQKLESVQNVNLPIGTVKGCSRCKKIKSGDEFTKYNRNSDGLQSWCSKCKVEWKRVWRLKNPDKVKKEYEKHLEYYKKYPERRKANNALNNAIQSGKIKREPCQACNSTKNINGHHEDYSKPFEVNWLCPSCHKLWHQQELAQDGKR